MEMEADLILFNGKVCTMDPEQPTAQAVAIAGNRILAVGNDADLRSRLRSGGKAVDLGGRTAIPGLIDAHVHFGWHSMAVYQGQVDLDNVPSKAEAVARVAACASTTPSGRWIRGGGWNRTIWSEPAFPTATDLDALVSDHPVAIEDKSRHATWVNSRALAMAGITAATPDPPGGEILRNASGEPTGILLETAADLVHQVIPESDLDTMVHALRHGMVQAQALGLTGFHDPGHPTVLAALQVLRANGELGLRALVHLPTEGLEHATQIGLRSGLGDEYLRIGGIKIFADGALGPQTAHMVEPYEGSADNVGLPTHSAKALCDLVLRAHQAGLSVAVHAIGDRANRSVLDAIEKAQATLDQAPQATRPALPDRVEHVQLLHADDLSRLARLGVVASMQPIHATSDMEMAERYWSRRSDLAYAWQSLLKRDTWLAFGSDAPVETLDPLAGIHAAVTRRRADGSPGKEGWIPAQRLSVTQAVQAYTLGAARASGEQHLKGSLSPGKLADVVVLSRDIFRGDPMQIVETRVEMTVFDGRIQYEGQEGGR